MAPRTTTIQNSIEIDRPAEVVFDYCVEPANEPEWNPRTRWIRRLGEGPLNVGSRFEGEWIKGSPMTVEFERFERPTAWATFGAGPLASTRHPRARSPSFPPVPSAWRFERPCFRTGRCSASRRSWGR